MVKMGDKYEKVRIGAHVVNGLINFNKPEKRADILIDKSFIKALLIGIVGLKRIKENGKIEKGLIKFMKGKRPQNK